VELKAHTKLKMRRPNQHWCRNQREEQMKRYGTKSLDKYRGNWRDLDGVLGEGYPDVETFDDLVVHGTQSIDGCRRLKEL